MKRKRREAGLHPALWTFILFSVITGLIVLTIAAFNRDLRPYVPVTLTSDRSGLVMESGAAVKLRGVQVGRVASIQPGRSGEPAAGDYTRTRSSTSRPTWEHRLPATTAFGAKYVDLIYPDHPSPKRLAAGAVLQSRNVSTEVNTVFQNLVGVLNQIDARQAQRCAHRAGRRVSRPGRA